MLLHGCTTGSLPATPIIGGTSTQRDAIQAELQAFESWVGVGQVVLRKVAVEAPPNPENRGQYSHRTIWVAPGLDELGLRHVLRHELCHAIDFQHDLVRRTDAPEVFDDSVFAAALVGTEDHRRNEAMAKVCELGPATVHALVEPCTGEDSALTAVARWVESNIYIAVEPFGETNLYAGEWTLWAMPDGLSNQEVLGTIDPGVMMFRGDHPDGYFEEWYLDTATAEEVAYAAAIGDPGEEWEAERAVDWARGLVVGSRKPGILGVFLSVIPMEPRLVEATDDGLTFPEPPVCMGGGAMRRYGTTDDLLRITRIDDAGGTASWADLSGLDQP